MSFKSRIYSRLVLLALAAAAAFLLLYHVTHYVFVDFRCYPKSAVSLDLTDQELTVMQFDQLRKKLPNCDITWNVPLSSGLFPSDSQQLTLDSLAGADVAALAYFPSLKEVDARACVDYGPLLDLLKTYPELKVEYMVLLGGTRVSPDARRIEVKDVPQEELFRLGGLPELQSVVCAGGEDAAALQEYCHNAGIAFSIRAGDEVLSEDTRSVAMSGAEAEQLSLLYLLPNLRKLHLIEPQAEAGALLQLREVLPHVAVDWTMPLGGIDFSSGATELDISEGKVRLSEIREKLAYFPEAELLYLGQSIDDNEALADFREEMRDTIKVVWEVTLGKKLTARTDDKTFMPVREHVYYFNDEEAYNLRYCEEMECIDIGHMSIHNIDFVEFMPNLTYLILAHTQLQYIEPISTCKNLKFLELDWSPLRDLSPLVGCTGLEDLNLGQTYASFEPIKEMTWLKNLWVIKCSSGVGYQMSQALPDTRVQAAGDATVASGWRRLPNYYAMRDALGMYYMPWD